MKLTLFFLAVTAVLGNATVFADPTSTGPTTAPARSLADVNKDLTQLRTKLAPILADAQSFSDPAKRSAASKTALPVILKMESLFDEVAVIQPQAAASVRSVLGELVEYRAALGDPDAAAKLVTAAADANAAKALRAQVSQLRVEWLQAGTNAPTQTKIADAAEMIAKAHPDSTFLTSSLADWAKSSTSPELADRLLGIAITAMNNPAVPKAKEIQAQLASARKLQAMENKPLTLTGLTVEDKPFSTADYKGKVILIDFWATWCGPCKATLPEMKATYAKYHADGLEIVGVSNDYSSEKLKSFVQEEKLPWVQLYDSDAGENREWNPVTVGYGISSIPHMFLIDRQGMLVSSNARATCAVLIEHEMHQHQ